MSLDQMTTCLANNRYHFPAQCELLQSDEMKVLGSSAVQANRVGSKVMGSQSQPALEQQKELAHVVPCI